MNEAIRRAAGRGSSTQDDALIPPSDSATDAEIRAWLEARKAQPKPSHGSADGGARSTGPGLTAAQRMNLFILKATGRIR